MKNIKNSLKKLFLIQILVAGIYFNAHSQIVFERTYKTVTSDTVIGARCGVQCHDGGYMLGGYAAYGMYASEMMLMKLDSLGNVQWKKFYGEMPTSLNCIYDIIQLEDSSYVCCGEGTFITEGSELKPNNSFIMRVDSHGNLMWYREFDTGWHEMLLDMELTETGVFCVGYVDPNPGKAYAIWILCDFDGSNSIVHSFSDTAYHQDIFALSVCKNSNNNFFVVCNHNLTSILIKTNAYGDTLMTRVYGLEYPGNMSFENITSVSNEIIAFGYYSINFIEYDSQSYYAKFDTDLVFQNENILPFDNELQHLNPSQLITVSENEFIIGGWLSVEDRLGDIFIKKFNLSDELVWQRFIGGTGMENIYELINTSDGGYMIIGDSDSFDNWEAIYLVKTDSLGLGNYTSPVQEYAIQEAEVLIYPNPAVNCCKLKIDKYCMANTVYLYDMFGKQVQQYQIESPEIMLNISELPVGMYIITDNNRSFQRKLIKTSY